MLRFLRRYSKYILVVFGTLLLITFLIPFAFTQLLQGIGRGRSVWATVGESHEKLRASELWNLQRELQVIQYLSAPLPQKVDRAEYWYLLVREASDAGLVGSPMTLTLGAGEEDIARLAAASGVPIDFARETLAKWDGVARLLGLYLDGDKYSDRRLMHRAKHAYHRVTIRPIVIQATAPATPGTYSDAELEEQMNAYADDLPGEGERGFGYKLPDRAKIEWIEIPAAAVRAAVASGDQVDLVALFKHWRLHEDKFGPVEGSVVPDDVREDFIDQATASRLDAIARQADERLRFARRGLERQDGYYVLPADWQELPMEELALSLQQELKTELPAYHAVGNRWLDAADLDALEGIGQATTDKFGQPMGLADLVMAARELGHPSAALVQTGVAGPPLRGVDGSVYLFRIVGTDRSRAPASVDEVREKLVADLDRLARYSKLVEAAAGIKELAVNEGLLSVAMLYDTPIRQPLTVTVGTPAQYPEIGASEATSEAIVDHAMSLPQDVPTSELPVAERTMVIPVDDAMSLLVAEITTQTPLTRELYQTYLQFGMIQQAIIRDEISTDDPLGDAFSYAALAKRHQFALTGGNAPDSPEGDGKADDQDEAQARMN